VNLVEDNPPLARGHLAASDAWADAHVVPAQIARVAGICGAKKAQCQSRLADLTGAADEHHLIGEIGFDRAP
jgi:hypothetical protein